MRNFSTYPPSLDGASVELKREEIREYFHNTFDIFEKIFELLKDDSVFYKKSEINRHPMIFYFGHTATFFINKLINMKIIPKRINPEFESIFAVGVDEMSWDDLNENTHKWPQVSEVRIYRDKVRALVNELISTLPLTLPIKDDSAMWIILMGIEHERIHIETSLVLHRQMPLEFIKDLEFFKLHTQAKQEPKNEMITIPSAQIKLGKEKSHKLYGWDNEYGVHSEEVGEFQVSKYLVSNGEFMEFVLAGGYENEEYWCEEGKRFLQITKAKHPSFWVKDGDGFEYRSLCEHSHMPRSFPVDVNALEAEAFCRYKSQKDGLEYALISEVQHRALYDEVGLDEIVEFDKANQNFKYFGSCAVDKHKFVTKNSDEIYDVVGNVWQWSSTLFRAFDGFKVHEAYDDFSTPTFDEQHALILGSSWASSGNLIMKHSRYAFRKHFFQNAGFRYVVSENKKEEKLDIYETDELISQYCDFQYGESYFGVKNFAIECAKIASSFAINKTKALDLGCATGRASFELAKEFDTVEGVDFSVRFVGVGAKLKDEGYVAFSSKDEGELSVNKKVTIHELGYEALKDKVNFWQGDACNLKPSFNGYDLVMATNLIDRLYQPKLFLETIAQRLNEDGILVITSPYTWQESSTKKEFWLGGYKDEEGREIKTLESLKEILADSFELVHTQDLEFVIKETARKYQHTISQVSVWKKVNN